MKRSDVANSRPTNTARNSDFLGRFGAVLYSQPPISPGKLSNGPSEIVRPTVVGVVGR